MTEKDENNKFSKIINKETRQGIPKKQAIYLRLKDDAFVQFKNEDDFNNWRDSNPERAQSELVQKIEPKKECKGKANQASGVITFANYKYQEEIFNSEGAIS